MRWRCTLLFMSTKIFIAVLLCLQTLRLKAQDFDHLISKIFFSIDLAQPDTSIVSVLKSNPDLKYQARGWTMYGPMPTATDTPIIYSFTFDRNPYFPASFTDGSLSTIVIKRGFEKLFKSARLETSSCDVKAADSIYEKLDELFSKSCSKKWRAKDIDQSFTIKYYIDKQHRKKVMLMKYKPYRDFFGDGTSITVQVAFLKE